MPRGNTLAFFESALSRQRNALASLESALSIGGNPLPSFESALSILGSSEGYVGRAGPDLAQVDASGLS